MGLLDLIPAPARLSFGIGLASALFAVASFTLFQVDRNGYKRAEQHYQAETARLAVANLKTILKANSELQAAQELIAAHNQELNDVLLANQQAAAADPASTELCLPADSVRRINAVR